jgi:hypothetical protein
MDVLVYNDSDTITWSKLSLYPRKSSYPTTESILSQIDFCKIEMAYVETTKN